MSGYLISFALETTGLAAAGAILVGGMFWFWFCTSQTVAMPGEGVTEEELLLTPRELEAAELALMEADRVELWRPDPERLRQFDDAPSQGPD